MVTEELVEIRPSSNVFATYRRLSYKPWYAVAEFVDNSTQSFFDNEARLTQLAGEASPLEIRIYHDAKAGTLTISDTAFGMNLADFKRAVQLNSPPPGTKTRNEYGMGLKTAACWMGSRWSVRSKELGATQEYFTEIDVDVLASEAPETLAISVTDGLDPEDHYTIITVTGMYRSFYTKTTGRIKELLGSMYRRDLATGMIAIYWNDDPLTWQVDPVFKEKLPDRSELTWRRDVEGVLQNGLSFSGWVAIRMPGNARRAGLHLFRRNRIIVGGPGQGWKPSELYNAPNSFASQRLVGELDLDGWPVTQAKDGFDWDGGLEEELVSLLQPQLQDLISKASGTLKDPNDSSSPQPTSADALLAVDSLADELASSHVGTTVEFFEEEPLVAELTLEQQTDLVAAASASGSSPTVTAVGAAGVPTIRWWLLDSEHPAEAFMRLAMPQPEELHIFVNLRHPFVEEHVGGDQGRLGLYLKFLLADALVDRTVTRRPDSVNASSIRMFKDSFLRNLPADGQAPQ